MERERRRRLHSAPSRRPLFYATLTHCGVSVSCPASSLAFQFSSICTFSSMASNSRQRDVLPLPLIQHPSSLRKHMCKSSRQRHHNKCRWIEWANDGINTLNSSYGYHGEPPLQCSNASQQAALDQITASYRSMADPGEPDCQPAEALRALLAKSSLYNTEASTMRPYVRDSVSVPPAGSVATPLSSSALDADVLRLGSGCESLLRSSSSATSLQQELGLRQPYCDPSLVNNPKKYAQFLWRYWLS